MTQLASLTVAVTDPQTRVQLVEFRTQVDEDDFTAWYEAFDEVTASGVTVTVDDEDVTVGQDSPYSTSVEYEDAATIERRVTYIGEDGEAVVKAKTFTYPVQYDAVTVAGIPVTASGVLVTTRRR